MGDNISVVMVNHNRRDDLRRALGSVAVQSYSPAEVIVVDNDSRDGSLEMLAAEFPGVTVIPLAENTGMDGYSAGFDRASGEFIFQMDNDSLMPDAGVLAEVVRRFREGPPDLAAVATRVEEWDGAAPIEGLRKRDTRRGPVDTGGFHSGGVGFRKELLDRVGYYNRDVFLYGAELFLQMKLLAAGYSVLYYPEILMLHRSSPTARAPGGIYYEMRNRYWFLRAFGSRGQRLRYFPGILVHDYFYAMYKGMPVVFLRALRDGLGRLPDSLAPTPRSDYPRVRAKVREVGSHFGLGPLTARVIRRLRMGGKK